MEGAAALITAISALMWPAAAIAIIFLLLPVIRSIIATREFSLEIGGFKFSAQKATEKLQEQIADLQNKVAELEAADVAPLLTREFGPGATGAEAPPAPGTGRGLRILWVDNHPANNAFEASSFEREGHAVRPARSTAAALQALAAGGVDLVISDMGRVEDGVRDPEAGMTLLREMRARGLEQPFAFYTSAAGAAGGRAEALRLGVIAITDSFTTLSAAIKRRFGPSAQSMGD